MEMFSRLDKDIGRINDDRQILNSIWQRTHRWIGHVLRHDGLLHAITEGRMKGKPTRGSRRIQMLHDLADDESYVALKWAAEDREGWRHRERMSKTCCTTEDYQLTAGDIGSAERPSLADARLFTGWMV